MLWRFVVLLGSFGLFSVAAIRVFAAMDTVWRRIEARHPEALAAVDGPIFLKPGRILKFAAGRQDQALGDPELSRRVEDLNRARWVALGAWACSWSPCS